MAVKEKIVITADNKTARAFREVQKSAKLTSAGLASMSTKMAGVAVVGAAAAAGLFLLTKRAIENASAIRQVSDKVGLAVESLQELRFAAETTGVATNTLDMAMQRFSRRVGEAVQGKGELVETLNQYGIAVKDAEGRTRDIDDVLDDYADAIMNADSAQEQLRLGFKGFDSEGAALVNMFRDGSIGLQRFRDEAQRLGIVMSADMVRGADAASVELIRMQKIISVNLQKALLDILPTLESVTEGIATLTANTKLALAVFKDAEDLDMTEAAHQVGIFQEQVDNTRDAIDKLNARRVNGALIPMDTAQLAAFNKQLTKQLMDLGAWGARLAFLRKEGETIPTGDGDGDTGDAGETAAAKAAAAARKVEGARAAALLAAIHTTNLQVLGANELLLQEKFDQDMAALAAFKEAGAISALELQEAEKERVQTFEEEKRTLMLERLDEERQINLEQMQIAFDEKLALKEAHDATLEGQVEQHLMRINQREAFAAELNKQIWESGLQGKVAITGKLMGQLSVLMESNSKKMFQVGKAAAISQTIIDTYAGAQKAFTAMAGIPYVGPILGAIAAAAAIAAGLQRVQAIRSQSFGGGGSVSSAGGRGGSGGGGAPSVPDVPQLAPPANDVAPSRVLDVTIVGHSITMEQMRDEFIPIDRKSVEAERSVRLSA